MNEELLKKLNSLYHLERGTWRMRTNNNAKTPVEITRAIANSLVAEGSMELLVEIPNLTSYLEQELQDFLRLSTAITGTAAPTTPAEYIAQRLEKRGIRIADAGNSIYRQIGDGQQINMSTEEVLTILNTDLWEFNRFLPANNRLKEGDIKNRLQYTLLNNGHMTQAKMGERLRFNLEHMDVLDMWLTELHSLLKIAEPIGVWKMLVKHMMWLVKRNIYSKPVKNDIWLQIMGKQGTGKSFVARKVLFAPINDFYIETELSKIDDIDREVQKFTSNFVVNFDEVAIGNSNDPQYKVGKKMLNNLKAILTRDVITVRAYHTQKQENRKKTFTAFSSANTHLYDVIFDDTGMRRFFEFNSTQPKDTQFNHDLVTKLGLMAEKAWQAIDEDLDDGYWVKTSEEGKYVFSAQENYFPTNSTVAMWARECKVVAGSTTLDEAYADYQYYCRTSGNSFVSAKQGFITDMRHLCKGLIDEQGFLKISYDEI